MSKPDSLAQQILVKVKSALRERRSPWPIFFGLLVESNLGGPFEGMSRQPTDAEVKGWLSSISGFPQQKVDIRLARIGGYIRDGEARAEGIAHDWEGWFNDLKKLAAKPA